MKKSRLKLIINALTAGLCVILFAYLAISLLTADLSKALTILLSLIIGVIVTYLLNSIIHELGHLVVGLISGLKFSSIQFLWLYIGKEQGKIKIRLKNSNGEVGLTELIPTSKDKVLEKYVSSALGGLVASFLLLTAQIIIALFSKSLIVYAGLGVTFPITAYILLINAFPVFENNDGYFIYTYLQGGEIRQVCKNYYEATALLYSGVEPSELEPSLLIDYQVENEYSVGIRYLRYLAYLQSDEERAIKELRKISDLSKFTSIREEVFEELFFSALTIGDDKFVKTYEQDAVRIFEKENRPQSYRAHAVYRIKNGEIDWAKLILKSGIKFCDSYAVKGVAKAEKRYMELILNNLGSITISD